MRTQPTYLKWCQKSAFLLSFLFISTFSFAQTDTTKLDSDQLFKLGREEAFNGNREKARKYLRAALAKSPNYSDVRIFLGRTYSWDGSRDDARKEFKIVLAEEPDNMEAMSALADVEIWDDKYEAALEVCNKGLRIQSNDEDLLYRKAKALKGLNREKEAIAALQSLFAVNAQHKEGRELLESIDAAGIRNLISLSYSQDWFKDGFQDPAHFGYLQYGRRTSRGSLFLRYNHAERFNSSGNQFEIDLYPSITRWGYLYLNYGHSETSLFPQNRYGAELYFKLPRAFEGSVGFRYLHFGPGSDATLYTATLGKYIGNYWLSARTFLTPGGAGLSNSYIVQARRYLNNAESYIGIVGGFGFSPDFTSSNATDRNIPGNVATLRSRRVGIDIQKTFGINWLGNVAFNVANQEYLFDPGKFKTIYGIILTVQYRF